MLTSLVLPTSSDRFSIARSVTPGYVPSFGNISVSGVAEDAISASTRAFMDEICGVNGHTVLEVRRGVLEPVFVPFGSRLVPWPSSVRTMATDPGRPPLCLEILRANGKKNGSACRPKAALDSVNLISTNGIDFMLSKGVSWPTQC